MNQEYNELENVIKLSRVEFPHPIDASEVFNVLEYITDKGNYSIMHYNAALMGRIEKKEEETRHEKYIKEISGVIWQSATHTEFNLERALGIEDENGMFKGININSPGRDFDEISEEELQIWKNLGNYVQEYFSNREIDKTIFG